MMGALAIAACVVGGAVPVGAQGKAGHVQVPAPLEAWVPWVMHGHPEYDCAQLRPSVYTCGWPGELSVEVADSEGRFRLGVWLDRAVDVRLPGDGERWPQDVTADGGAAVVGSDGADHPMVRLSAGAHTVEGRFRWSTIPEVLTVPPEVGRVELSVRGERALHPRLDAEGRLWLQVAGEGGGPAETDSLRVSIHRRIADGVPLRVTNRLELNVGGRAREVVLGKVLLTGARPMALRGDLPSQVQSDGVVKVYVKPGTHIVELDTVIPERVEALTVPSPSGEFFDPQEVWVWMPDEGLRSVEVGGLPSVDPERTTLASDWRTGTTFLAEAGASLTLKETRRGEMEAAPNALRLSRQLWLDLDGDGYTVRDSMSGEMHQGWRLNTSPEGVLGRASQGGDDLLITIDPVTQQRGVELRNANVALTAEMRMEEARGDVGIVGWDHDVQSLSADLSLPPGWELLGGEGVDQMSGTWFESWTLFDFFFVLMVALSLGKLCGWRWTPLALAALCLAHGHDAAPQWVWIHLLASLALLRVLPDGWWRRGVLLWRAGALIFLVVVLVPFGRDQVRFALHPQVSEEGYMGYPASASADDRFFEQTAEQAPPPDEGMDFKSAEFEKNDRDELSNVLRSPDSSLSRSKANWKKKAGYRLQQVDPNAVVQTGPGLPEWQWRTWHLSWSGPVRRDHRVSLWLLSPGWNRGLTILRVALLIILGLLILAWGDMTWRKRVAGEEAEEEKPPKGSTGGGAAGVAAMVLAVAAALSLTPAPVSAQQQQSNELGNFGNGNLGNDNLGLGNRNDIGSDGSLLGELERRLLADRACDGPCVVVSGADFKVEGLKVTMRAEVHARRDAAWFLPGPSDPLRLDEVRVDGLRTGQLRREPGGLTAVRLSAGRHTVELVGTLVHRDVVTIQFDADTRPHRVTFESEEWAVDGIKATGVPDNSLQLTRRAAGGEGAEGAELSAELPPWFHVTRRFALGLPWQVITEVERENVDRPQIVKIPLVNGEKLITEGFRIEEGKVLVDFPRGSGAVSWTSELDVAPKLDVAAASGQPWTEDWVVECSRIWRCDFSGLVPVRSVSDGTTWGPLWKPWPGEHLEVAVQRPEGAEGQAATVQNVRYTITPGKRLLQAQVHMTIRASQGSWQKLGLPADAELQELRIDGAAQTIRPEAGTLNIPIKPGAQSIDLTWQQPWDRALYEEMPKLTLGSRAVNGNLSIVLGEDRWLLWATGPAWGPAVLFWSHLVLLLIAAFLLGRSRRSPLKTWEWLLLAIGVAQIPALLVLFPVFWFFVLAWREREPVERWWVFNLLQLGLVLMTLIAVGVTYGAIHANLLFDVDMQVQGANSTNNVLNWYVDQVDDALPGAGIFSLPLYVWRLTMLGWALWLVSRLLKWAPWAWRAFSKGGLWRPIPKPPAPAFVGPGGHGGPGGPGGPHYPAHPGHPAYPAQTVQPGPVGPPGATSWTVAVGPAAAPAEAPAAPVEAVAVEAVATEAVATEAGDEEKE